MERRQLGDPGARDGPLQPLTAEVAAQGAGMKGRKTNGEQKRNGGKGKEGRMNGWNENALQSLTTDVTIVLREQARGNREGEEKEMAPV